jgi:hypothetical protein
VAFGSVDGRVDFLPVEAVVLKKSLIFRNPKMLQEHLRNLGQIGPVIVQRPLTAP